MKQETPLKEQRRSRRRAPSEVVPVMNMVTGEKLGQVGNLSAEGLMIITHVPISEGLVFQLGFSVVDMSDVKHTFDTGAVCLWCLPASSSNTYWAGFEIIDIADTDAETLRDIVVQL